jgi:hypothetical protein
MQQSMEMQLAALLLPEWDYDRYMVHAAANLYFYSADFHVVNQFALTSGP